MTPRDSTSEHEPFTAIRSELPVDRAPRGAVRTGARLGWWRSAVGLAAVVLGIRYVAWQLSLGSPTPLAVVFMVCEIAALAVFVMTLVSLFDRGTRTEPGPPAGTLDIFITVCGEPLELVEAAIRTTMAIDYPHRTVVLNDGRIAGKPGWRQIDELGERLGATVLTRTDGHRSKAGNLNHGLTHSNADVVATVDADHRADPDLAVRLLRWFGDPGVAFVAAAQRFELDRDVLNHRQRFFFDVIQPAKDAAGCAISCGSGVAYRRRALDDVGGFSEWNVVEDLHTSYRLHAAGWRSVYEREAVTSGLAPQTAGEYAHQRGRWALDTMRILFFDNPLRRRGLRPRVRWHYLHTTTAYLLAIPQTMFLIGAPLYLGLRIPVAGPAGVPDYLAHALPYLGLLVTFFASVVGGRNALRTFRSSLFDSAITVVAIVRALAGVQRGGVTKKVRQRRFSYHLAWQLVLFTALIVSLTIAVFDSRPGASVVAVAWAAINAWLLVGPLAALSERPAVVRRTTRTAQSAVAVLGLAGIAATAVAVGPTNLPVADPRQPSTAEFAVAAPTTIVQPMATEPRLPHAGDERATRPPTGTAASTTTPPTTPLAAGRQALAAPAAGTYVGISSEALQTDPTGLTAWSAAHGGARPVIVNWFQQWGSHENRFREDWVRNVAAQGAVPMITWEPWAKPDGRYADPEQPDFRLELIVAGTFDGYITAWAEAAAAYGNPILLRFMHEFNGEWYPWSVGQQGQTDEQYVAAWRHVHDLFERAGATNVSWVWSVIGDFRDPRPAYPGDDVVDWVATTVLNSAWPEYGGWFDYATLTAEIYPELATYGKPIMLSEVATNAGGGDAASWYAGMFDSVEARQPLVDAVVVFDMGYDERTDYRMTDAATAAFSAGMDRDWFAPPVVIGPAP